MNLAAACFLKTNFFDIISKIGKWENNSIVRSPLANESPTVVCRNVRPRAVCGVSRIQWYLTTSSDHQSTNHVSLLLPLLCEPRGYMDNILLCEPQIIITGTIPPAKLIKNNRNAEEENSPHDEHVASRMINQPFLFDQLRASFMNNFLI